MKLGGVVEHVTRCLCTKFEPFPVAGFCAMTFNRFQSRARDCVRPSVLGVPGGGEV